MRYRSFLLLGLASLVVQGVVGGSPAAKPLVARVAHRGASGYAPENTFAAFEQAMEFGVEYIELDIHLSKDGHFVVIHDSTLDRTTDGKGKVGDHTLEELRKVNAGKEGVFEPIPTLDEVLDRYAGRVGLLIELKSPSSYPGMEEKLASLLSARGMDKWDATKLILQSFDHASVRELHTLLPNVATGVLVQRTSFLFERELKTFSEYASFYNPKYTLLDASMIKQIHNAGMKTFVWTVNDPEQMKQMVDFGVDGIISNYPDLIPTSGE